MVSAAIFSSFSTPTQRTIFYFVINSTPVARGCSVLAKSVTPSRIDENLKVVKLDSEDLSGLAKIAETDPKRYVYPDFGVNFGFADKNSGIDIL